MGWVMGLFKHIVWAGIQWVFLAAIRLVLLLMGLVIVAVGIPFRVHGVSVKSGRDITNLPRWLWLWGNDADGLWGDRRLWWHDNADRYVLLGILPLLRKVFPSLPIIQSHHYLAMYWWAAIRNPVNNLRYVSWFNCVPKDCDIRLLAGDEYQVDDKYGFGGIQFTIARLLSSSWFPVTYYGFYWVHEWNHTRGFVIRLGHKIEPRHVGTEEPKGMVFKINPYKAL